MKRLPHSLPSIVAALSEVPFIGGLPLMTLTRAASAVRVNEHLCFLGAPAAPASAGTTHPAVSPAATATAANLRIATLLCL